MTPLRLAGLGSVAVLVAGLGWWVIPTHEGARVGPGETELDGLAKAPAPNGFSPVPAEDVSPAPRAEALVLAPGQTLRLMGVEPGPSSAQFCDEANWTALGPVAERVVGDAIFVDARRWAERTAKERSSLASWMSKCLQAGREVAIHSSSSGDLLARYDSEHGYRSGTP